MSRLDPSWTESWISTKTLTPGQGMYFLTTGRLLDFNQAQEVSWNEIWNYLLPEMSDVAQELNIFPFSHVQFVMNSLPILDRRTINQWSKYFGFLVEVKLNLEFERDNFLLFNFCYFSTKKSISQKTFLPSSYFPLHIGICAETGGIFSSLLRRKTGLDPPTWISTRSPLIWSNNPMIWLTSLNETEPQESWSIL